jgi:alkylated DNA repair dioxygenase AlkB
MKMTLPKKRPFQLENWLQRSGTSKKPRTTQVDDDGVPPSSPSPPKNDFCEALAQRLCTKPHYLTKDGASWYLHVPKWFSTPSKQEFDAAWNLHPTTHHALKLFGKTVYENRWSQSFGVSYTYSGSTNYAKPIPEDENHVIVKLIARANALVDGLQPTPHVQDCLVHPYNGCLMNWYEPDHTIGLHSDTENVMCAQYPIFSVTWGGTRRFLLWERSTKHMTELWIKDGDLVVMGGTCQQTHRHEVPK